MSQLSTASDTSKITPSVASWLTAVPRFVYTLFTRCPKRKVRNDGTEPFLVIGHRGSPEIMVENTLESFEQAILDGANALELDLCITEDQEVVLWHDWDPNSLISKLRHQCLEPIVRYASFAPSDDRFRKPTNYLPLDVFRTHFGYRDKETKDIVEAHIPTFNEFIEWVAQYSEVQAIFLDVKIPSEDVHLVSTFMEKVKEALDGKEITFDVIYETTEPVVLQAMKEWDQSNDYVLDAEAPFGLVLFPERHSALDLAIAHSNSYSLMLRPRQVTIAPWITFRRLINYDTRKRKRFNKKNPDHKVKGCIGATINDKEEMECLIRLGMNGLQTDRPKLLRETIDELLPGNLSGTRSGGTPSHQTSTS